MTDLRFALRQLKRSPGFTLVAVTTLALGIGGSSAMFSIVKSVLLSPLPYDDPSRLVSMFQSKPEDAITQAPVALPNFKDWEEDNQVMKGIAAWPFFSFRGLSMAGDGEPRELRTGYVSPDFFRVLGVQPTLGRALSREDDAEGNDRVLVLSDGLWKNRFGADSGVVGRTITLDEQAFVIIGVAPPQLALPNADTEVWAPLSLIDSTKISHQFRFVRWLVAVGRMEDGVSLEQAASGMTTVASRLDQDYSQNEGWTDVTVVPLQDELVGDTSSVLWVLLAAMGLVLAISSTNVASLLLARGSGRARELAVRNALGAGSPRLVKQLLVESLVLAALGGTFGVLLAFGGLDSMVSLAGDRLPRAQEISLDAWALGFAAALSMITGLAFGILPAWIAGRRDALPALKEGGRVSASSRVQWLRSLLVGSQLAVAVIVVVAAGLLINSLSRLYSTDAGFERENLHVLEFVIPTAYYPERSDYRAYYEQVLNKVAALPGVRSVGATHGLPGRGSGEGTSFEVPSAPSVDGEGYEALWRSVSWDYFRTMGITLRAGREFDAADRSDGSQVAVINRSLAERLFPGSDAVGQFLDMGVDVQIVGVVDDVKHRSLRTEAEEVVYRPMLQHSRIGVGLVVRSTLPGSQVFSLVRGAIWELNPNQPFTRVSSMEEVMGETVSQTRFVAILLGMFAALGLTLAAIGVYGVISYTVTQRNREIGIRMAFGARAIDVLRSVVGGGARVILIGLVVGTLGALAAARVLSSQLYEVSANDPVTFAAVISVLLIVAIGASVFPAVRAARVDPAVVLKEE
jgi:putative ABC transport system permease protein